MESSEPLVVSAPSSLNAGIREEIGNIAKACEAADGRAFPLILGPPAKHFLCQTDGRVVGYMEFVNTEYMAEAWGMVHPDFRRHGTGSALLTAVKDDCRTSGKNEFTLACDQDVASGGNFARAMGGTFINSEHRLTLDPKEFSPGTTSGLEFHSGTLEDIDIFADLTRRAYGEPIEEFEHQKDRATALYSEPNRQFFIAFRDGSPVGTVATFSIPTESQIYINALNVAAEYQGRGYGREILGWLVQRLSQQDWTTVSIETYSDNDRALNLYETCGFKKTVTFDYYRIASG